MPSPPPNTLTSHHTNTLTSHHAHTTTDQLLSPFPIFTHTYVKITSILSPTHTAPHSSITVLSPPFVISPFLSSHVYNF
uniref:Uncharacterized protein n=1 Tax=Octopus bimaculoides TaxID=37653 RepID=A0A0L8HWG3_OCTBM